MKDKPSRMIVVFSVLFVLSATLTVNLGLSYFEEKNRPLHQMTQQAERVAAFMADFHQTATALPEPTETRQPASISPKLLLPTATKAPTATPNPHAVELQEALALIDVNFSAWQSLNPDVQAWIHNQAVHLDHPILVSPDNEYYLTRDIDLTYKEMGSVFFDFRNNTNFSHRNTVIYGHNFDNGLMFSNLVWYKTQAFYEQNSSYYLYTPNQVYRVDIAAGMLVSETDITYLNVDFESDIEFRAFLQNINENSVINSDIELGVNDRLVTLYTCTNDWQGQRFVVIGKLTWLGSFSGE